MKFIFKKQFFVHPVYNHNFMHFETSFSRCIFLCSISKVIIHRNKIRFHNWEFGTINIRSGKEKLEGAKMYMIATEVARANLSFCALQEVRHGNTGDKIIELKSGKKCRFFCVVKRNVGFAG